MARDPKSNYYDVGGIEVLDVIKAKLTTEQFEGYCLGNIIKYSLRANHKGQMERDIEKIGEYSKELITNKTGQQISTLETSPIEAISLEGTAAQPVLTIAPIEQWDWQALSKAKAADGFRDSVKDFWDTVHPDYKAYGGL